MPERRDRVALGFDFGLKRIGIAAGDTVSGSAAPCATVTVGPHGPDWREITRLLRHYRPDVLIVGSPRHADGTYATLAAASDHFAAELTRRAALPVQRVDEFASSIEAAATLRAARARGQRRRRVQHADMDAAAAAIILQRWLRGQDGSGGHAKGTT